MTNGPDRPVGDVYEPAEDASGRPPERDTGDGGEEQASEDWPASAYEPAATPEAGSAEPNALSPRPESADPALARLLLDHLREAGGDALRQQGNLLPLDAPELRTHVLDRLEEELEANAPELLVATGRGATEVGTPLADRTGLPLVRESDLPGDAERWPGTRVALVGSVLRPVALADVLRAVETRGASVVAILGIAARDGEDTELVSIHYNLFYLIHL